MYFPFRRYSVIYDCLSRGYNSLHTKMEPEALCAVVLQLRLPSTVKCPSLLNSQILFYRMVSLGYETGFIQLFLELVLKARYNKNLITGLQLLVLEGTKPLLVFVKVAHLKVKAPPGIFCRLAFLFVDSILNRITKHAEGKALI